METVSCRRHKAGFVRLWTVHPRYLDSRGLTALWREALLAREVLLGRTRGYRHHSQLRRFQARSNPVALINTYLLHVHAEAQRRGFAFDRAKLGSPRARTRLPETVGQLEYEWRHLQAKLRDRSPAVARAFRGVRRPDPHPLFRLVSGNVRPWEIRAR
jgi:hypothetical protein